MGEEQEWGTDVIFLPEQLITKNPAISQYLIHFYITGQTTNYIPINTFNDTSLPSGICVTIIGRFKKRINKFKN